MQEGTHGSAGDSEEAEEGAPSEDVYDWFRRGIALLEQRQAAEAEQFLARAAEAVPHARSVREALARAQFDSGSYQAALDNFRMAALADPADHYAQFGWGLAAARLGDFESSAEHLALAVALRPEADHYRAALRQTRATLRARAGAFGTVKDEPTLPPPLPEPGASDDGETRHHD